MVKKYVLYVDMYTDHAEIDGVEQLSTSEILAILENLILELTESWIHV